MRLALAVLVGAVVASFGALVLGEYEFRGAMPYVAAVLFGLVVAEAVVSVARRGGATLAVVVGALSAGGLVWAAWISSGRDWGYVPGAAWTAAALAGATGAARTIRSPGSRAVDSSPSP